ncbi:hypothetical protein CHLV4139_09135 [Campylobacter helveticus]|uniref:hypothetical protein n=1 Tax=Campylobacter helveticus TaxID=28898 RepID=UPI00214C615F|nr:hypothetical protein [Campylobacter helveticus]MCR2055642.1 hypothetical protein [Campylobacter helveticus]
MLSLNRPSHYKKRGKAKERSTTFYLSKELLKLLKDIAEFENVSLSIMVERSLNYAKNGDFKRASRIKKKAKIYAKKGRKFADKKREQKGTMHEKCLFD